jgi:hypothetical protein
MMAERVGRRWRAGVLAVLMLGLSTGCAVQLAYDNLDRLARWFASDFVSMDDVQRSRFDAGVAEVWAWHRSAHVPRYANFFDAVRIALADGTDPAEVDAIVNTIVDWALEIEQQSLPVAIDLLVSLSDGQVAALGRRMAESNDELAQDERKQTLEQSRRAWQKETASRFSRFSGRLTPAQNSYLAEQSVRYLPDMVLWAEYRARWQADLLKLLADRADRERFDAGFRQLTASRERYYGAELDRVWDNNRSLSTEVTAWLVNNMTVAQRGRFDQRLEELALDFRGLADPGAPAPGVDEFCGVLTC